jgi:hypothetical protein
MRLRRKPQQSHYFILSSTLIERPTNRVCVHASQTRADFDDSQPSVCRDIRTTECDPLDHVQRNGNNGRSHPSLLGPDHIIHLFGTESTVDQMVHIRLLEDNQVTICTKQLTVCCKFTICKDPDLVSSLFFLHNSTRVQCCLIASQSTNFPTGTILAILQYQLHCMPAKHLFFPSWLNFKTLLNANRRLLAALQTLPDANKMSGICPVVNRLSTANACEHQEPNTQMQAVILNCPERYATRHVPFWGEPQTPHAKDCAFWRISVHFGTSICI